MILIFYLTSLIFELFDGSLGDFEGGFFNEVDGECGMFDLIFMEF